jgi:hypothetical protein
MESNVVVVFDRRSSFVPLSLLLSSISSLFSDPAPRKCVSGVQTCATAPAGSNFVISTICGNGAVLSVGYMVAGILALALALS